MIRIDLLEGVRAKASGTVLKEEFFDEGSAAEIPSIDTEDKKKAAGKFLLLLFFPGMLSLYEYDNISKKEKVLLKNQQELKKLKKRSVREQALISELESFEKEKNHLQNQIDVISSLSKWRLREVKTMDALQRILSNKVWLTKLLIKESAVTLSGYAVSDSYVNQLINDLEQSIYFEDVKLRKSMEKKIKRGKIKSFEISFLMGDFE